MTASAIRLLSALALLAIMPQHVNSQGMMASSAYDVAHIVCIARTKLLKVLFLRRQSVAFCYVALWNRADHYIFALLFLSIYLLLLLSFFLA